MQDKMMKMKEELADKTIEASAGGGMVSVVVNGKQELVSITIDKEVVDPEDTEMLEDLIIAAINQGLDKSREMAQEEMKKVAGGMLGNLPGGLKIPGLT